MAVPTAELAKRRLSFRAQRTEADATSEAIDAAATDPGKTFGHCT
jgi:hypothetical protein